MASLYQAGADLRARFEQHPYQTLLIAAGVGYILGGGLFTRHTLNAVRLGARIASIPIVRRELLGAAEAALSSPSPDPS